MDNEKRMRLLQFVTGTCRLPVGGFADLMGMKHKHAVQALISQVIIICFNLISFTSVDYYRKQWSTEVLHWESRQRKLASKKPHMVRPVFLLTFCSAVSHLAQKWWGIKLSWPNPLSHFWVKHSFIFSLKMWHLKLCNSAVFSSCSYSTHCHGIVMQEIKSSVFIFFLPLFKALTGWTFLLIRAMSSWRRNSCLPLRKRKVLDRSDATAVGPVGREAAAVVVVGLGGVVSISSDLSTFHSWFPLQRGAAYDLVDELDLYHLTHLHMQKKNDFTKKSAFPQRAVTRPHPRIIRSLPLTLAPLLSGAFLAPSCRHLPSVE